MADTSKDRPPPKATRYKPANTADPGRDLSQYRVIDDVQKRIQRSWARRSGQPDD